MEDGTTVIEVDSDDFTNLIVVGGSDGNMEKGI